jgi:deoxyribose-phosphate aldolase
MDEAGCRNMEALMLDQKTLSLIDAAARTEPTADMAGRLVAMVDLTTLEDNDTPARIATLCRDALTPIGPVAAVCVYPRFVAQAKAALAGTGVRIATVIDFPRGDGTPEDVLFSTEDALKAGADEIDLVFPYGRFLSDAPPPASKNIRAVREVGGHDVRLKVILEVSAYPDYDSLTLASKIAIDAGADFLKTSTGKTSSGASLEAAAIMLTVISESGLPVGFKASGGVRELPHATGYLALAESIMGAGWATADTFRIGASSLLPKLLGAV